MGQAVRSNDLDAQRWDLLSAESVPVLLKDGTPISDAINEVYHYLNDPTIKPRTGHLYMGWRALARAMGGNYQALAGAAAAAHEGATKYGVHNWLNGFPIRDVCNHILNHLIAYQERGPGEEDDLGHASWGFMAAYHFATHRPDLCQDLLDRGHTLPGGGSE